MQRLPLPPASCVPQPALAGVTIWPPMVVVQPRETPGISLDFYFKPSAWPNGQNPGSFVSLGSDDTIWIDHLCSGDVGQCVKCEEKQTSRGRLNKVLGHLTRLATPPGYYQTPAGVEEMRRLMAPVEAQLDLVVKRDEPPVVFDRWKSIMREADALPGSPSTMSEEQDDGTWNCKVYLRSKL